jgi:membrane protein YdbS with pleckstrin-like domain
MGRAPTWSPHPLAQPGRYIAALIQIAVGGALLLFARTGAVLPAGSRGDAAAGLILVLVLAASLFPKGDKTGRLVALILLSVLGFVLLLGAYTFLPSDPIAGTIPGALLAAVGLVGFISAETKRRRVRFRLADDHIILHARRWGIEHTLPLDAVREINARRTPAGRLWGYGTLTARVRTGTMKDHMTRPVVAEEAPPDALCGSGWDEEERFHMVAAHPYKRLAPLLEERVRTARLAPQERRESELANRLAEDLEGLRV